MTVPGFCLTDDGAAQARCELMIDTIGIREFKAADLLEVLAINSDGVPGLSRLDAVTASALLSMASIAWVAILGGQVAGYLIGFLPASEYDGEEFLWFKRRCRNFIYIDQIATAASLRGCGVGRRLYAELALWSASHACLTMVCEVNLVPPNSGSLAFHRTCGFSEVGRLRVPDAREVILLECGVHLEQSQT